MKICGERIIEVSLPEKLGIEVENYVKRGWFINESEVLRAALQESIQHNRFRLMERFMKEDIEWALKVKKEG
jgi:Arc/MetJ-type ribon-helix-helix transcriptional regulator